MESFSGLSLTGLWVKHAEELRCTLSVIMLLEEVQEKKNRAATAG